MKICGFLLLNVTVNEISEHFRRLMKKLTDRFLLLIVSSWSEKLIMQRVATWAGRELDALSLVCRYQSGLDHQVGLNHLSLRAAEAEAEVQSQLVQSQRQTAGDTWLQLQLVKLVYIHALSLFVPNSCVVFLAVIRHAGVQQLADCSDGCHPDALKYNVSHGTQTLHQQMSGLTLKTFYPAESEIQMFSILNVLVWTCVAFGDRSSVLAIWAAVVTFAAVSSSGLDVRICVLDASVSRSAALLSCRCERFQSTQHVII